jgi:hypothetical protein
MIVSTAKLFSHVLALINATAVDDALVVTDVPLHTFVDVCCRLYELTSHAHLYDVAGSRLGYDSADVSCNYLTSHAYLQLER